MVDFYIMDAQTKEQLIQIRELLKLYNFEIMIDFDSIEYGVCDDIHADWQLVYLEDGGSRYITREEINNLS